MSVITTYSQSKLALGSDITLVLVSDMPSTFMDDLFIKLWLNIYAFESKFSRFLPTSELSMFNKNAGMKMHVSPEFSDILKAAKHMSLKTDGLYNPFILPALQKAGYKKSFVDKYSDDEVDDYSHRAVSNIDKLNIGESEAIIPANTAIDLGGIGKGYLADQLASISELSQVHGYWLSLGGDIIGAGLNESGDPWQVSVQDATSPDQTLNITFESNDDKFAVATSGTITRRDDDSKKPWHHIIDPTTFAPAKTDIMLATVEAESATNADVLASCAVILGSKRAPEFLSKQGVRSYLLQVEAKNDEGAIIQQGKFIQKKNVKI